MQLERTVALKGLGLSLHQIAFWRNTRRARQSYRNPRSRQALKLVSEWNALLERESGGDENMSESKRQRWAGRRNWPAGTRNYVASLYDMEWSARPA
jgi:hypothetical protein